MKAMQECVIIGGGIAGLTAAFYAGRQGIDCVLLDDALQGGVMRTSRTNGFLCDDGPNVFVEKPALTQLIQDLGLTESIRYSAVNPYKQHVFYQGKATEVPKSAGAFLKSSFFSWQDKLRILGSLLGLHRHYPDARDCSIADLLIPLLGKKAVYALVEPALQGIYGGRVDELSAQSVLGLLYTQLRKCGGLKGIGSAGSGKKNIVVLEQGAAQLTDTLMSACDSTSFRKDTVCALRAGESSYHLELASGEALESKTVLITTAGKATASYLQGLCPEAVSAIEAMPFAPLIMIHFSVPSLGRIPEKSFGVLFPPGRESGLLGVMCKSVLFPHVSPPDKHLLSVCVGGRGREDLLSVDDDTLLKDVSDDLEQALGIAEQDCLGVSRWDKAIPQYQISHADVVTRAMDTIERDYKGIFFAGVDRRGVGVPDRIALASEIVNGRLAMMLGGNR